MVRKPKPQRTPARSHEHCIIGAGPAGLGAALELARHGIRDVLLLDANPVVGGLARTEQHGEARYDVGPHRFFTHSNEVRALWRELLGEDLLAVDRLTRIRYRNRFINYPIELVDALRKLGPVESSQAVLSFARAWLQPRREALTFEDWIVNRFGRKLFDTFFKTYTEKVWGIPCSEIGAEWAAQRIKGLDVLEVLKAALLKGRRQRPKTLVEEFYYPRHGAGQLYEAMAERAVAAGATLQLGARVTRIHHRDGRVRALEVTDAAGVCTRVEASFFFSSVPLPTFFELLEPACEAEVLEAARALYFRDHISVNLLVDRAALFPDQWIYVHTPEIRMARLTNYGNFSAAMVRPGRSALGVEYFVFRGDELWRRADAELIELAREELAALGLLRGARILEGHVLRELDAYPTYYLGYRAHYDRLRRAIDRFGNLLPLGRAGLYKYNNQDHSLLTGLLAARGVASGQPRRYSVWEINEEEEYLESGTHAPP